MVLVYKYGGLYMDSDAITAQPIPTDTSFQNFVINDGMFVLNGIFKFARGHPYVQLVLEKMVRTVRSTLCLILEAIKKYLKSPEHFPFLLGPRGKKLIIFEFCLF